MVSFLDVMRFLLCCVEGDRVDNRYQTIPESIERLNGEHQWKSPWLNHSSSGPSASSSSPGRNYLPEKQKTILLPPPKPLPPPQRPSITQKSSTETQTNANSRTNSNPPKPPELQRLFTCQKTSIETQTNVKSRSNFNSPSTTAILVKPQENPDSQVNQGKSMDIGINKPSDHRTNPPPKPQDISHSQVNQGKSKDTVINKPRDHRRNPNPPPKPQENLHSQVNQGKSMDTGINKPSDRRTNPNPPPKPSPAVVYTEKSLEKKPQVPKTFTLYIPNEIDPDSNPCTSVPLPPSVKPPLLLSLGSSSSSFLPNVSKKLDLVWVQKVSATPLYSVPKDFREAIEKDIVPQVLRKDLTPLTYKNYFAALLYAEDFYCEKWSDYCIKNVTLELQKASIYAKGRKNKNLTGNDRGDKLFVAFEIDYVPERRPFLLSRDFVLLQPSRKGGVPFRGLLYRVVKSNIVLAEFGEDFHQQHSSNHKYDVSFTFNRVCLKRCHQALAAATETLFDHLLFPSKISRTSWRSSPPALPSPRNLSPNQLSAVYNISRLNGSPPFLVEGPLSATLVVIPEAVLQIYRTSPSCRLLINAPTNGICDVLMTSLLKQIPKSEIFRANAAFREVDVVPDDILPLCPIEGECFTCPSLQDLRQFKVVLSTYMSSFRLHNEGIRAGHFSHIFLVDASSTMEPETTVPLANLANENTVVVVTGAIGNFSRWVRSDMARKRGLQVSYFERLLKIKPYSSFDSDFVVCIRDKGAGT